MEIKIESSHREWAKTRSWSGGRSQLQNLQPNKIDKIETILELMKSSWDETQLNDFFWFEEETYLEWIGQSQEEFNNRWEEELIWK